MHNNYLHIPVLLNEVIKGLQIQPNGIYLDGTFGRGGHSRVILSKLNKEGRLLAIDRDPAAISSAKIINDARFAIIHGNFSDMALYIAKRGLLGRVNGILLDLGVSSPQVDDPERGFSFMHDGPLDMRMNVSTGQSAEQWLTSASIKDISWVLKTFGEERFAKRIARAIFIRNCRKRITRTTELAEVISKAIPYHYNRHRHPATRSFRAIRIYINSELEELKKALHNVLMILAPGGRISVISFHSLEDRIVKHFIRYYSGRPIVPAGLPLTEAQIRILCHNQLQLKLVGQIKPSSEEIRSNPRARSSILRIAEKLNKP